MQKAKIFMNGKSQAVRLPKEFRLKGKEVYIKKIDDVVMLLPKKNPWGFLFSSLGKFSEDFMKTREQPPSNKRTKIFS